MVTVSIYCASLSLLINVLPLQVEASWLSMKSLRKFSFVIAKVAKLMKSLVAQ